MTTFARFVLALGLCFSATFAGEAEKGKAEALVKKGAKYIKDHGKEAALKEFNNPKGGFVDGELYIFAYDMEDVCLALPSKPAQVGRDLSDITDADGKPFFKDFHKVLDSKAGSGWIQYKWNNPLTKKVQDKLSFIMKIPDQNMYIGCGIYK
ncbi:MAG: cache domain-containing protein [Fibrobacteres bacterium]|jgi:cytochrome c|nr:cache domain-containing protein [Fibrobacterota bacterium]